MRHLVRHLRTGRAKLLPRKRKRLAFILAAILVGCLPLLLIEVVLRCCHLGFVSDADDPYVGFAEVRPLFELNEQADRYEIAPARQMFFRPDSFPAQKQANAFRIFCLGGSTVQGRPYAIETSFTTWLKLNLQTADPERHWEVVNCGGISYASYRLVPILREVLEYQPDLLIICTGHNEFLEDRTYAHVKQTPRWILRAHGWLSRLHSYNALRSLAVSLRGTERDTVLRQRPLLPAEVDAMLDYNGGLDDYHRDKSWQRGTIAHFEFNLRRMMALAGERGVPVVLVNPPYNLKDSPPFKYANRDDLTTAQRQDFDQLWEAAKAEGITVVDRIALLRQAVAIDDQHAGVRYHLGKCYANQRQFDAAKAHLVAAKDEDICPLRILSPMRTIIRGVAKSYDLPLVDGQQLFERLTPDGITGEEWFVDHVHPSIRGHQQLASALFDALQQQDWVHPTAGWQTRRDREFLAHLQSLDAMYYIRGQQRLEGLRKWAQGRASRIRPPGTAGTAAADAVAPPSKTP